MDANDPRHGTYRGANAHWQDGETACQPCRDAAATYKRQRHARLYLTRSNTLMVPALGTTRRIQALVALGHTMRDIDDALGRAYGYTSLKLKRYQDRIYRTTATEFADVYNRLCMVRPEGRYADRTRKIAARKGWAPPLAWNNIDNPGEQPTGHIPSHTRPARQHPGSIASRLPEIEEWAAQGATLTTVLARLGVRGDTFYRTCNRLEQRDLYRTLADREPDAHTRQKIRELAQRRKNEAAA